MWGTHKFCNACETQHNDVGRSSSRTHKHTHEHSRTKTNRTKITYHIHTKSQVPAQTKTKTNETLHGAIRATPISSSSHNRTHSGTIFEHAPAAVLFVLCVYFVCVCLGGVEDWEGGVVGSVGLTTTLYLCVCLCEWYVYNIL